MVKMIAMIRTPEFTQEQWIYLVIQ